jgi:hypothetical protein
LEWPSYHICQANSVLVPVLWKRNLRIFTKAAHHTNTQYMTQNMKLVRNCSVCLKYFSMCVNLTKHILTLGAIQFVTYEVFVPVNTQNDTVQPCRLSSELLVNTRVVASHKIMILFCYNLRFHVDHLCGLVVRGPGFDFRRYQIFWEIVGLERGPLSFARIIEELLERKVAAPVLKTEINGRGLSLRWPRDTYPLKLALTSPTSDGESAGIVRCRTTTPEFFCLRFHVSTAA